MIYILISESFMLLWTKLTADEGRKQYDWNHKKEIDS